MHPVSLSCEIGRWQAFHRRRTHKNYAELSKRVWARDRYTCQFCGFQAKDFQEVINLDQDYKNNKLENCVTSCIFCAQCHFIESVGKSDFGGGTIVYLPELTQAEVNSMCHVLFCAMINDTSYRLSAQTIYRSLKFRSQIVEDVFGEGTSQPSMFGQLLIDYRENGGNDEHVYNWMCKLRLLPSRGKFKKQIQRWAEAALDEMSEAPEAAEGEA